MTHSPFFLTSLDPVMPQFSASQGELLEFLSLVHGEAAVAAAEDRSPRRLVESFGVRPGHIERRHFECPDVFQEPQERKIYSVSEEHPEGASISDRADFFSARAREVFEGLYEQRPAPAHLIHVTCTGYVSPSAAQWIVADRGWDTAITHAYHMGCYASLPAVRLAMGQVAAFGAPVDVVHTEMCSLHMNPSLHTPEQIVVQSLFADGHIRYRVGPRAEGPSFQILAVKEKVLPGTQELMGWKPAPWGMQMHLSREVPERIRENTRPFVRALLEQAGMPLERAMREGIFAIHPGGPKIIDSVAQSLELREEQIVHSRKVLRERGNMSSATIPHVWKEILDSRPAPGTPVVSLAFGPGLTVFGSVFEVAG